MVEIIRATTRQHHAFCVYIRIRVFMDEQKYTIENELEADEDEAVFFLAMEDDKPVGTVRYRILDKTQGRIERLAVLPEARRRGIGPALMETVLAELSAMPGIKEVELIAQEDSVEFHKKFGFIPAGAPHMEAGHPHYLLRKTL